MAKGGTRVFKDESGELQTCADLHLESGELFWLDGTKILYTWVEPTRLDTYGMEMLGSTRKLSNNVRDVFKIDFIIEVSKEKWIELSEEEKSRLLYHELWHCRTKLDKDGNQVVDSCGRLKLYLQKHDVVLQTFSAELEKFGLSKEEIGLVRALVKVGKRQKKGELKETIAEGGEV